MMSLISRIGRLFFNRTTLTIVLLLLLSLAIWFGGPLIAIAEWPPLGPSWVRWTLIAAVWFLWFLKLFIAWWRSRNVNAALLNQLAKMQSSAKPGEPGAGEEEVAELNRRFKAALDTLKKTRFSATESGKGGWLAGLSKQYLYQLPWYAFIGAPGSGKTTALINAGLTFPLADQFGKAAIRGVGGTRNCDWWFTNEAVLIDTAGRYTTQESNQAVDRAEWQGFLGLLKKFRPRQPLNGVLLTVSVADLLQMSAQERELHAATLKARLNELREGLGLQFPVYVLVTKCDLLAGFMEYFLNLNREERAQVWGFTLPYEPGKNETIEVKSTFNREFDLLYKRLNDGMHQRLLDEPDLSRRALAYTLPQQFAGIRDVLARLLVGVFSESKFNEQPLLRGVYFTSGTQEGTPFDRVLGAMQRTFKVDSQVRASGAVPGGTGKSFFLQDLLQKVIFPESFIAGRNLKAERRQRLIQYAGLAACGLAFIGLNVAWWMSYRNNAAYVQEVNRSAEALREAVAAIPTAPSEDAPALAGVLSQARRVADSSKFAVNNPPWSYRWGLYQGAKLDAAAQSTYQRLLEDALMPRIHARLTSRLQAAVSAGQDATYEALKAYLMMYETGRIKADFLIKYVGGDWMAQLPGDVTTEARQELLSHLEAMLKRGAFRASFPMNAQLVAQAREQLAQQAPERRAYNFIKSQLIGIDLPEFTVAKAAGDRAPEVFTRRSGKPLTSQGIPGYFSERGYNKHFVEALGRWGAEIALEEAWILGRGTANRATGAVTAANDMQRLERRIRELYLLDFAKEWQAFLQDVRLKQPRNMNEVIEFATVLGAPDSPLVLLVREVARQTQLVNPERSGASRVDRIREEARRAAQEVSAAVAAIANSSVAADRVEAIAEEQFRDFIRLATPEGKGQIDQIARAILEYANALRADQGALSGGATSRRATDAENALRSLAASSRTPVREILEALIGSGEKVARAAIQSNASAQARGAAGAACGAVAQSYPFRRGAAQDAFPQDFAQVFGPDGSLKRAFDAVAGAIDMSRDPWVPRPGIEGAAAGGPGVARSFQNAAAIRETFFAAGRTQPGFELDVRVQAAGERVELEADGTSFLSGEDFKPLVWTGAKNGGRTFLRVGAQKTVVFSAEGFWALHRLLDRAATSQAGPIVTATLPAEGREVRIEFRARSFRHPLTLPALRQFGCPG